MRQKTTAQDILNDIEFEIIQGMVSKEAFGPALEAVRQFQNRQRSQTFKSIKLNNPYREIISRQFQTTDMLLGLLQEMALRIQALQAAINNLGHREGGQAAQPPEASPEKQSVADTGESLSSVESILLLTKKSGKSSRIEIRSQDEILNAMRPETITIPLQTRAIRLPVIGGLLTRLRIFYQRPAMYYTSLLSERQAPVNRTLGDRVLYLETLLQEQQQQIQALKAEIESSGPKSSTGVEQVN